LFLALATVQTIEPDAAPDTYLIPLRPGADVDAYVRRVAAAQPDLLDVHKAAADALSVTQTIEAVLFVLAGVMIVIAVAFIFNTLLLNSRERVRDTATLKAIGMSPRQVMVMIAGSAAPLAIVAGVIAIPAGIGLDRLLVIILGTTAGGNDIPPAVYEVFTAWELVAIPLAGVAVAVAAALIPGRWAARTKRGRGAARRVTDWRRFDNEIENKKTVRRRRFATWRGASCARCGPSQGQSAREGLLNVRSACYSATALGSADLSRACPEPRIRAVASSRDNPATSVSQTSASIPVALLIANTRRIKSSSDSNVCSGDRASAIHPTARP
jgi:hypothetical protein